MSASLAVLLYLTLWTVVLASIAPTYRSLFVLTGKKTADCFPRSGHDGPAWYLRSMDAHANSVENLPLYIAIFAAAYVAGQMAILDAVAYFYLSARIAQSIAHLIGLSHWIVMARFTFWIVQIIILVYVAAQLLMA